MKTLKDIISKYLVTDKMKYADFYSTYLGHLSPKSLLEIG